jgi:hypothetical protein
LKDEILELRKELVPSESPKKRKKERDMTSYVKGNSKVRVK